MACAAFITYFAWQAVVAGVTDFGAHIVVAPFADGARQIVGARDAALIGYAHVAAGALIRCNARSWYSHAALFGCWIPFETGRTLTRRHMIFQFAQRIRAAHIFVARILAVVVVARFVRATVAIAATTDNTSALLARLSHWTLAMALAFDEASIILAVFAVGAVVLIATGHRALAVEAADAGVAIEIGGTCGRITNASVFREIRNEFEFVGAGTNRFAIFDRA